MSSSVPHLSPAQLRAALDVRDLSDPAAGQHYLAIHQGAQYQWARPAAPGGTVVA